MTLGPDVLARSIVKWYNQNARDLPWRKTNKPYDVWLSEIILQQTTVAQGQSYYLRFLTKYPTLKSLAEAPIDDILKLWQGLGYYSRARNLHFTANHIVNNLNGEFPNTYKELLKLKGVGPYTAAAISSFCFNENHVVVDGNVSRVISRLYEINQPIDDPKVAKDIKTKAQKLCNTQKVSVFNQAIMEFGAMQCLPKKPSCHTCPLQKMCRAFQHKTESKIPFKSKKIKKRTRYFTYSFFIIENELTIIQKRQSKDIWQGLYEFPLVESVSFENDHLGNVYNGQLGSDGFEKSKIMKQQLTHQTIYARFLLIYISKHSFEKCLKQQLTDRELVVEIKNLKKYAWPRLIDLYLNDLYITLF